MDNNTVNLQISKEIVNPIVEAKIKDAIVAAMGGSDRLIEKVVDSVLRQQVNSEGKVSSYSSENKFNWIDIIVTQQLRQAVEAEVKIAAAEASHQIKDALITQLKSKKGSSMIAAALVDSMVKTFANNWTSNFSVSFNKAKDY